MTEDMPIRVAGRDSMKELLADMEGMTDIGIASVLKNASPSRTEAEIQQAVDEFRGRAEESGETRKPVHPASLRSHIQHAIRSLQRVHSVLAEWEGTRTLPRDIVDVAVLRVLVTSGVLQDGVRESVARMNEMESEDLGLVFDGVPDGRLRSLLRRDEDRSDASPPSAHPQIPD